MPPAKVDPSLALSIAGFAGFQLLNWWNSNAPKTADLRSADPMDSEVRRKLRDADVLVGGTAVIFGSTIYALTGDTKALALMGVTFVSISLFSHTVLNAAPRAPMAIPSMSVVYDRQNDEVH